MRSGRTALLMAASLLAVTALFVALLVCGPVDIPAADAVGILFGREAAREFWRPIVMDSRLPMALSAAFCGSSLAVAGLVMQSTFQNPLAGPSVLGVSSGASLGVAVVMLGGVSFFGLDGIVPESVVAFAGALLGAGVIVALLIFFSSLLRSGVMLLIVGMMVSYLSSSVISLLNFFSPAEGIRAYMLWGLGSFSGVRIGQIGLFSLLTLVSLAAGAFYIKPLDALLLGERYAGSMGYSMRRLRLGLLGVTGLLTAVPTAFCGPVGFLGLVVPHLCRLAFRSSAHAVLYPACVLFGAAAGMGCALLSVLPASSAGVLPINVITPIVGVPVIIYILLNRERIIYFN